jgi:hypothetical protein
MTHYFPNVPDLGNVAVSRHAQERMKEESISEDAFRTALYDGDTIQEGTDILWREHNGVRVVVLRRPVPFKGAMLVKTVYRVGAAARAIKG